MYKLKQLPEDFHVKEVLKLKLDDGRYSYYLLKKKACNTIDAVRAIAKAFHVQEKYINYAGIKDRQAVTEQHISISNGPKKDLELENLELKFIGTGKERLNLGTLEGNEFRIVIRNINEKPRHIEKMLNLFDDQRFGRNMDNHIIGKHIIKGEWKEACEKIDNHKVSEHLVSHPNDFVGALKKMPRRLLKLYVHAYQSYLWNELAKKATHEETPIIGFTTETTNEVKDILEREGLTPRDFVIRQIPEITMEGGTRPTYVEVKDLEIREFEEDELNSGMKKCVVSFYLPKGSYATQAVKQMCL